MLDYFGRVKGLFLRSYLGRHEQLAEALQDPEVKAQINVGQSKQGGHAAIHVAMYGSANVETVKVLVENDANLQQLDSEGRLPLHLAANSADPAILEYLLGLDAVDDEMLLAVDGNGRNILHAACMTGSSPKEKKSGKELVQSIEVLLNAYVAAASKQEEQEGKVSKLQAIRDTKDVHGFSPLQYAKHYGYNIFPAKFMDQVKPIPEEHPAVKSDYFGRTELLTLAFAGDPGAEAADVDRVKDLLAQGEQPMVGNRQAGYRDALHHACNGIRGPEMVRAILASSNTNPNSVDGEGSTALHFAAFSGRQDIAKELLAHPAIARNLLATDINMRTVMHAAVMASNRLESRKALIRDLFKLYPGLLARRDANEHTPLMLAQEQKNQACIDLLMELEGKMQDAEYGATSSKAPVDEEEEEVEEEAAVEQEEVAAEPTAPRQPQRAQRVVAFAAAAAAASFQRVKSGVAAKEPSDEPAPPPSNAATFPTVAAEAAAVAAARLQRRLEEIAAAPEELGEADAEEEEQESSQPTGARLSS